MRTNEFLSQFYIEKGLSAISKGSIENGNIAFLENITLNKETDQEAFFTPVRFERETLDKKAVIGTRALWVDVDHPKHPVTTFRPSVSVWSGGGWHLYWFLKEPLVDVQLIELYNKVLIQDTFNADKSCWNANRFLRIPGSFNAKYEGTAGFVEIKATSPTTYSYLDFEVLRNLDTKTLHKIRTGDQRGFTSRSERDWNVIQAMVRAGATDELIETIFRTQPVGNKYTSPKTATGYLPRTISKVRASNISREEAPEFTAKDDGYYVKSRNGLTRVSTFTLEPIILLDGSYMEVPDAIVCNVHANGYTWPNVVFPREAFNNVKNMDNACPVSAWQWLSNDMILRRLLPFLMEQLRLGDLPKTIASPVLGMHKVKDKYFIVGTDRVVSSSKAWADFDGPLAWKPVQREHPATRFIGNFAPKDRMRLRKYLPLLNKPEVIWVMIGWYAASHLKPWLEENDYRFPILNVTGTRGSGKTTLIKNVFSFLFGNSDPKTYDAGTTKFVTLALLGGTTSIPVAFSEFRYNKVEEFLRYILLSYDTGHDPRGRPDQTTVDYPLSAPFSIDGEDLISDPAAQQRIVVARLRADTVEEGSEAYEAYKAFSKFIPRGFAGAYVTYLLQAIESGLAKKTLDEAREDVFEAYPSSLPDRVRNNHIVVLFGTYMFCDFLEKMDRPDTKILIRSIRTVYNMEAHRGRLIVDDMVEACINAVATNNAKFKWAVDEEGKRFYFQLGTVHPWWTIRNRDFSLEREAIRAQLKEVEYLVDSRVVDDTYMYGVDLEVAQQLGLDVPSSLTVTKITMEVAI